MAAQTAEPDPIVPLMPERTPKALRRAIADDAPPLRGGVGGCCANL